MTNATHHHTKNITVAGREVTILEPNVEDLLAVIDSIMDPISAPRDIFENHVLDHMSFRELLFFTTLTQSDLAGFTLSELRVIAQEIRTFNPDFFAWKDKMTDLGRQLAKQASESSSPAFSS